ncbi:hypothetical protein GFS31_35690 [Leptolyngbya sp. BL0902]|nr:hypothetical protein GFS31_35690 [Leptolyngbya sp. BL0902]
MLKVALVLVFIAGMLGLNPCAYGPYCYRRSLVFGPKDRKVLGSKKSGRAVK